MPATRKNCTSLFDVDEHTCMNCRKKQHSLLSNLSCDELAILNKHKYEVSYRTGETICKEGTKPPGLLCLHKGKVKITRMGVSGNEQIVALKKPVDFIGFRALMGENIFLSSAVALEDTSICILDKNDFFEVIDNNSRLAFKIIQFFADELNEAEKRLVDLSQKHIRARLADALLLASDIYGLSADDNVLNVMLKRADLAALANMTTANAIRVLSSFSKENLIEIDRRKIKINNLKALQEISTFGR